MTAVDTATADDVRTATASPPSPRRLGGGRTERWVLLLSALSSFALIWVAYENLTPASGIVGFVLCWVVAFLATVWLAERELHGSTAATDRTMGLLIVLVGAAVVGALATILGTVIVQGLKAMHLSFFSTTMAKTGPLSKATDGGAFHSIIGTFEQVGIATTISVPLSLATAVFLSEGRGRLVRLVRTVIDAMSGVPSIVAGLFIYAAWVLRFGFSGLAAGFALSILMLPTVTRTSEEVLRLVPSGLKEAGYALGSPRWRTTLFVVLPTARSGLVTAILLGVARAVGDTAALIATTAGFDSLNLNPFHGQQDSLPLFVYKQIRIGLIDSQTQRAWTGALVLLGIVLILFVLARIASSGQTVRLPRRRRSRSTQGAPE